MPFAKKSHNVRPRTHAESRAALCSVCLGKHEVRLAMADTEEMIQNLLDPHFTLQQENLPNGICKTCQRILRTHSKNPENPDRGRKLPPKVLYEKLSHPVPSTRNSSKMPCDCTVCLLARASFDWEVRDIFKELREQSEAEETKPVATTTTNLKQCSKCLTYIGRGRPHTCTKATKRSNLEGVVKSCSTKSKARVISSGLKSVFAESGVTTRGGTLAIATGGKPVTVTLGLNVKGVRAKPRWTHEDLIKLQTNNNLSDRTIMSIAAASRVVSGRTAVEPNFKGALKERNHKLDDLFSVETLQMQKKVRGVKEEENKVKSVLSTGVYCNDCDALIQEVISQRGLNPHESTVLVGLDDGQKFLKICATIQSNIKAEDDLPEKFRSTYSQGVCSKNFKDSSVKKLLILSAWPDVPENHSNIKKMLDKLDVEAIEFSVSADTKMLLLLCGKSLGKPKYNCPFCDATEPFDGDHSLYTIGDLFYWHEKYVEDGAKSKQQQHYQNVVNQPLITGPPEKLVLDLLNCPSLHILIGIVNKLIIEFEKNVFSSYDEGELWMETFLKKMCILRKNKQGKADLEGNQSRDFLKCLDKLEECITRESSADQVKALAFVETFRAFKQVVHDCFSIKLQTSYKTSINNFSKLYRDLGISVTPKVHMVERHIVDFFELKGEAAGMGFYSEQAMEAVHHDFKVVWEKIKVDSNHPDFGPRLKMALSAYNSRHM